MNIITGIWRLGQGMWVTMKNFVRPKVTEQYPENRGKKVYFEAFRGLLVMPHDEYNHHRCTACGLCMNACPNGTIRVTSRREPDPATGAERRVLDAHLYDLGSCTFCALCTQACPFGAIEWSNDFEHSVFTRGRLELRLNHAGSSLAPRKTDGATMPGNAPRKGENAPRPEPAPGKSETTPAGNTKLSES